MIRRLACEVKAAMNQRPDLSLVIGHGSGSFGHIIAARYHVHTGVDDWWGYAETGAAAQRLNRLVVDTFLAAQVPVVSVQPSASARCVSGELRELATTPIQRLLDHGLVPVVYGDVAMDDVQGSAIISTEQVLAHLLPALGAKQLILAGNVDGVFTGDPLEEPSAQLIPHITVENLPQIEEMLSGSHGTDVTGGMWSKVRTMVDLVKRYPAVNVQIVSGLRRGHVQQALLGHTVEPGTIITAA